MTKIETAACVAVIASPFVALAMWEPSPDCHQGTVQTKKGRATSTHDFYSYDMAEIARWIADFEPKPGETVVRVFTNTFPFGGSGFCEEKK